MEKLKNGTEMIDNYNNNYIYKENDYGDLTLYIQDRVTKSYTTPDYSFFSDKDNEFKILSEIDIQEIYKYGTNNKKGFITNSSTDSEKERELRNYIVNNTKDIEMLIQAIKQLDKKIK
jgi:hypothetical protein